MQGGTSKAWILETTQDSDDTGMKDNNESFSISIDNEEEKGNVSKRQHWQDFIFNGEENGTSKAKTDDEETVNDILIYFDISALSILFPDEEN